MKPRILFIRRERSLKRPLVIAAAMAIVVATLVLATWTRSEERPERTSAIGTGAQERASQPSTPIRPAPTIAVAERAAASAPAALSRGEIVDRLVAQATPEAALQAFEILNRCLLAKNYAVDIAQETDPEAKAGTDKWPKAAELCSGLSAGQLTMRTRLLIQAGEAGVPGSYSASAIAEQTDMRDDADLKAAMQRISTAAVRAGDLGAVLNQHARFNHCSDPPACSSREPVKALEYLVAYTELVKLQGKKASMDHVIGPLKAEVGQERAAQAIEAGRAMAASAKRGG